MKVADAGVIAHARHFLFQLFLYHQQVMVLEALLVVGQADLAVLEADEVQETPEVVDHSELQDHRRKQLVVEMDSWYYILLRSQV